MTAAGVTAVVLILWLIEGMLAIPAETFEEALSRIVGELPTLDPYDPPSREEIIASGAANELSTLGRDAAAALLARAEALGGEEGSRWLGALAFYTQKHLYTERIGAYLVGADEALAEAAANVLGIVLVEEDRGENVRVILSHYEQADAGVRARLVLSLAHLSLEEGREAVTGALGAPSEEIRLAGCEGLLLHRFEDEEGRIREALKRLAEGDPSERVREAAARALVRYEE